MSVNMYVVKKEKQVSNLFEILVHKNGHSFELAMIIRYVKVRGENCDYKTR